ncbi:hypothetical protein ACWENR_09335 [Micromonospora sp. NPDC004336]
MTKPRRARLSGIYASDIQVFRFYPDGLALDVLVKPAPDATHGPAIARWLRRESPLSGVHAVRYAVSADRISLTTPGHFGAGDVEVSGTWRGGRLVLRARHGGRAAPDRLFRLIWPVRTPGT